jgi:DNA-binding transcriptional ArsR family regulator
MAFSKAHEFSQEEIEMAELAKAIAHPARIKILNILNKNKTCITGELVEMLPLSQATVSQHLKELKDAGLITGEIDGPRMCYCLNSKVLIKTKNIFTNLFSKISCC